MAKAPLAIVIQHIRRMVDAQAIGEATDGQLVERFASGHEQSAFAVLLRRHGPMVFGVCRGVLRQVEDAEDVLQATFLLLARKAGSIRKRESVASWLHGVAYRLAVRAKAQKALRRAQEKKASAMRKTGPSLEEAWQELRPVLDEEMEKLPEKYRTALVLCYLEGKTQDEVARQLGCPLGTVRSRVGRARKLLQGRLTRRGLTLSAGSLAAFLVASTASATVGARILDSTLKAALPFATATSAAGLVSERVAVLVEGGLKAVLATKLKIITASLLAVTLVIGAGALAHQVFGAKPSEANQDAGPPSATKQTGHPELAGQEKARTDRYGDPLPPRVVARLGTVRFRHSDQIDRIAFSGNGQILGSSSDDGTVRLWEAATGKELRRFSPARTDIAGVVSWIKPDPYFAFAADGTFLVIGEGTANLRVLDIRTGTELHPLDNPGYHSARAAVSPNGKTIAWAGDRGRVAFLDVATGRRLRSLNDKETSWRPAAIAFSPDSRMLAAGKEDLTIQMLDVATGTEVRRLVPSFQTGLE